MYVETRSRWAASLCTQRAAPFKTEQITQVKQGRRERGARYRRGARKSLIGDLLFVEAVWIRAFHEQIERNASSVSLLGRFHEKATTTNFPPAKRERFSDAFRGLLPGNEFFKQPFQRF